MSQTVQPDLECGSTLSMARSVHFSMAIDKGAGSPTSARPRPSPKPPPRRAAKPPGSTAPREPAPSRAAPARAASPRGGRAPSGAAGPPWGEAHCSPARRHSLFLTRLAPDPALLPLVALGPARQPELTVAQRRRLPGLRIDTISASWPSSPSASRLPTTARLISCLSGVSSCAQLSE